MPTPPIKKHLKSHPQMKMIRRPVLSRVSKLKQNTSRPPTQLLDDLPPSYIYPDSTDLPDPSYPNPDPHKPHYSTNPYSIYPSGSYAAADPTLLHTHQFNTNASRNVFTSGRGRKVSQNKSQLVKYN